MSWKFVFKYVEFTFDTLEEAADYASHGGYEFLEWNGDIYFLYEIVTEVFSSPFPKVVVDGHGFVHVGYIKTSIKSVDLV